MTLTGEFLASLARVDDDATISATLPPACYADPAVFDAECRKVLRSSWLGVGRADRWAQPGDYATLSLGGVPVFVCRDESRRLRAFANTCRHRGTQLLQGHGNVARIACPFHGWTYGLDG